MYDHVLVGTDGSATAALAVEAAARLAQAHQAHQAHLTIVHAFHPRRSAPLPDGRQREDELSWRFTPGGMAESVVGTAADLAQAVACGGLRITTRAEPGAPLAVLLAVVEELGPDAVVVGNADVHRARVRRSIGHALSRRAAGDVVIVDTVGRGRGATAA